MSETPRRHTTAATPDHDATPRDATPSRGFARGTLFELAAPRRPVAPPDADFDRFGPYNVFECLGAGGMASVHRASIELADGVTRDVALKRLLPQLADDQKFVDDFIREAKLAAQLHHPNIVQILELGRIGRTYYIAMDLVRGSSLMSVLKRSRLTSQPTPIGVVISLMSELCDVLDYVASFRDEDGAPCPIVHRDLSPSNLLVTDDGHINVIDFGVAKAVSGKFMTNTGLVKGKLGYLAPEAIAGRPLDARADLFSAGVVMWELLAGRRLFKGRDELVVMDRIRSGVIPPPSRHNASCPTELDDVVMKALERDPDARWVSAGAIRAAIDEVRRHYRGCSPHEVARWKRELRVSPTRDVTAGAARPGARDPAVDESWPTPEPHEPHEPHDELDEVTSQEVAIRIYFNHPDIKP